MEDWACTIRKHAKKTDTVTDDDYIAALNHIKTKCTVEDLHYEYDKGKDHSHVHCTLKIPKGMFRGSLRCPGFNMKLKPITDLEGWKRYCRKEALKKKLF